MRPVDAVSQSQDEVNLRHDERQESPHRYADRRQDARAYDDEDERNQLQQPAGVLVYVRRSMILLAAVAFRGKDARKKSIPKFAPIADAPASQAEVGASFRSHEGAAAAGGAILAAATAAGMTSHGKDHVIGIGDGRRRL
jgi:hypothetical protein